METSHLYHERDMKKSLFLGAALLGVTFAASANGTLFINQAGGAISLTDSTGSCTGEAPRLLDHGEGRAPAAAGSTTRATTL